MPSPELLFVKSQFGDRRLRLIQGCSSPLRSSATVRRSSQWAQGAAGPSLRCSCAVEAPLFDQVAGAALVVAVDGAVAS